MSSKQPTVLLVPGAFGNADGFSRVVPLLEKAGFSILKGAFPSSDSKTPQTATCSADTAFLRDTILLPAVEAGDELVILAHSYGGIVSAGAAKGLDVSSRRSRGLGGGVLGLVYIAGNIALENESLLEAVGGNYPPFITRDKPSPGLAIMDPVMPTLYNDCDTSLAPELEALMVPHAYHAFETPATAPCWLDPGFQDRRVYVRTELDSCNPAFLQDMWIEKSGVQWEVVPLATSHAPFVSQPQAVADIVANTSRKFAATG